MAMGKSGCGSELNHSLKSGCELPLCILSIILSNCGIHDRERWQLARYTQLPSFWPSSIILRARKYFYIIHQWRIHYGFIKRVQEENLVDIWIKWKSNGTTYMILYTRKLMLFRYFTFSNNIKINFFYTLVINEFIFIATRCLFTMKIRLFTRFLINNYFEALMELKSRHKMHFHSECTQ